MTPSLPPDPPAVHVTIAARPLDLLRLTLCIEHKEADNRLANPWSKLGGKANWTFAAWSEVTNLAFSWAQDPQASRHMQVMRLLWLEARMKAANLHPTPYLLAYVWNRGWLAMRMHEKTIKATRLEYAVAVTALYYDDTFHPDPLLP